MIERIIAAGMAAAERTLREVMSEIEAMQEDIDINAILIELDAQHP